MLAVRKLLLADDSITIQKIVALTFADAGIEVISVENGTDAVQKLRENVPDVVLADVFMPGLSGYEVCEYVKQTESLKHIPVMLLVGSFEPFDEAEARRVGADDILTKPFQSIRTLMDKVGSLLGRSAEPSQPQHAPPPRPAPPVVAEAPRSTEAAVPEIEVREYELVKEPDVEVQQEADTKELPTPEVVAPPEEPMTTEELEITTADTQPLSPEVKESLERHTLARAEETVLETTIPTRLTAESRSESAEGFGDALLDLGHFEPASFAQTDDVVLDLDFDAAPESVSAPVAVAAGAGMHAAAESPVYSDSYSVPAVADSFTPEVHRHEELNPVSEPEFIESADVAPEAAAHFVDSEVAVAGAEVETPPVASAAVGSAASSSSAPAGPVTLDQLSPEVIDAIARRVVEHMSEKTVQEIAWEVVPQLADLMIKRKLEERETQNR